MRSNVFTIRRNIHYRLLHISAPHRNTASSLNILKNVDLRSLAFQTGVNSSGTKSILISRLHSELRIPRLSPTSNSRSRILSIDMGIRNLAFCILDVPAAALMPQISGIAPASLKATAWQRIAVSRPPATDTAKAPGPPSQRKGMKLKAPAEAFDPATFAHLAHALVAQTLLPFRPTHILIERQRYRTAGAPMVQEWTVRVNMFESMLHAVLRTLGEEHQRTGTGKAQGDAFPEVHSVSPAKVAQFYFAEGGPDAGVEEVKNAGPATREVKAAGRTKGKVEKEAKIEVAEAWLRGGLRFSEEAAPMRDAFLAAREWRKSGRKGVEKKEEQAEVGDAPVGGGGMVGRLTKLDDLADCLLQGLAWAQWEVNRRRVIEQGVLDEQ